MKVVPSLTAALLCGMNLATASPADSLNSLGLDLHRLAATANPHANLLLSPYSIAAALSMASLGAEGETAAEFVKVLSVATLDETFHKSFGALTADFLKLQVASAKQAEEMKAYGGSLDPLQLAVANRLFGQEDYRFKDECLARLNSLYGAPLGKVSFKTAPNAARIKINAWVEEITRKRIRDLLGQGPIERTTGMVLVNALYFKAPWEEEFSTHFTKNEPFATSKNERIKVPTMRTKRNAGYRAEKGWEAITLDYKPAEFQFVIVLPAADSSLAAVEKTITAQDWKNCAQCPERIVILLLPKFKIELPTLSLKNGLAALGMKSAFDIPRGSANFNALATKEPDDYLYISDVLHKTFISIDEIGTEAAAATAVSEDPFGGAAPPDAAKPITVKVDRPFLFAIQHRPSGACLFMGRVVDPR